MSKIKFFKSIAVAFALIIAGSAAVSCYDDSHLVSSINSLETQIAQLQSAVAALQSNDFVTSVQQTEAGFVINFSKSPSITITNGKDGEDGKSPVIDVVKTYDYFILTFSNGMTIKLPRYRETRLLTFEDKDYQGPSNIANFWTSLIDNPQYGGELLYGAKAYSWFDENNTGLFIQNDASDAANFLYGYSDGGFAVSNYVDGTLANAGYLFQLASYKEGAEAANAGGGANGSDNFLVGYVGYSCPTALTFKDNEPKVIESLYINNTLYTYGSLLNGDSFAAPVAENGFFKVIATGYDKAGETKTTEFYLADGRNIVKNWTKWDLSSLGAVVKVVFTVAGSSELYGDWGLNTPGYFAIDDVAVSCPVE